MSNSFRLGVGILVWAAIAISAELPATHAVRTADVSDAAEMPGDVVPAQAPALAPVAGCPAPSATAKVFSAESEAGINFLVDATKKGARVNPLIFTGTFAQRMTGNAPRTYTLTDPGTGLATTHEQLEEFTPADLQAELQKYRNRCAGRAAGPSYFDGFTEEDWSTFYQVLGGNLISIKLTDKALIQAKTALAQRSRIGFSAAWTDMVNDAKRNGAVPNAALGGLLGRAYRSADAMIPRVNSIELGQVNAYWVGKPTGKVQITTDERTPDGTVRARRVPRAFLNIGQRNGGLDPLLDSGNYYFLNADETGGYDDATIRKLQTWANTYSAQQDQMFRTTGRGR